MQTILIRFFKLQAINDHPFLNVGLLVCWVALVLITLLSIRTQPIGITGRAFWALLVILVPVAGLTAYLFFCLSRADWSFLAFVLSPPKERSLLENKSRSRQ